MTVTPKEEAEARERNGYIRGQVKPRVSAIALTPRAWIPVVVGILLGVGLPFFVTVDVEISDLASVGINYAALSFGGCITGAVLAVSLPSERRVRSWASARYRNGYLSRYGDLVFWLTWAAISQLAVLFVSIVAVVAGGDEHVIPADAYLSHRLLLGFSIAVFFYAVGQLLTLVGTLSQLGNVIDFVEWKAAEKEQANRSE
jgi:hypothetical protein